MVGRSAAMQGVFELVDKVAAGRTTVLITGESGVGKELVARAVHAKSPRAQQPFIPVNCGAIPEGLIERELFGHVKGAFTGAQSDKAGLFQTAEGGTLFLDEIAELPTPLQVKLLRAIQDRRIRQVGGTEDVEVDVRIVAATNRDLPAEVRAGRFREDLYYRLNVVQIRVPPLRDRREDILLLADHFLRRFGAEHRRPELRLSREARRRLDEYGFPGNVRELENLIERAVALSDGDEVTLDALPAPLRGAPSLAPDGPLPPGFSLEAHLAGIERELIDRALAEARDFTLSSSRSGSSRYAAPVSAFASPLWLRCWNAFRSVKRCPMRNSESENALARIGLVKLPKRSAAAAISESSSRISRAAITAEELTP